MKKTNVLHIFGKMDLGGAETFIMNIFRNIDRSKIDFTFAVVSKDKGFFDEEIEKLGGQLIYLPSPHKSIREYKKALEELLLNVEFSVIHSHVHFFSAINLKVAKKCKVPIRIAHSHTSQEAQYKRLKRLIYEKVMKYIIEKNGTHFLGCSTDALNDLYFKNNPQKRLINNGINLNKFLAEKQSKYLVRESLGIPIKGLVVGHVGAFRPEKNHNKILEIFKELYFLDNNSQLILVGEGKLKSEMESFVSSQPYNKNVHFLGIREDIDYVLDALDVFLFPSIYEGLGIAIIEAQAKGLQCIASDNVPKEVNLTGNVRFLSLEENNQKWAQALLENIARPINNEMFRDYNIINIANDLERIYLKTNGNNNYE